MNESDEGETDFNNANQLKPKAASIKGLDIQILTETPDVTGLSIYLNSEPLDYLNIFKDSQPEKVAYDFCVKHKLNYEYLPHLTQQIKAFINKRKTIDIKKKSDSLDDLPESPLGLNKERRANSKGYITKYSSSKPGMSNEKRVDSNNKQAEHSYEVNDCKRTPILFPSEPYQEQHNTNSKTNSNSNTKIHSSKSNYNYHKQLTTAVNQSSKSKRIQHTKENKHKDKDEEENADIHIRNQIDLNELIKSKINYSQETKSAKTITYSKRNDLPLNYGERLFHKGVKMQERAKDKILTHQKAKETINDSQLTFKPTTNPISFNALSKRMINRKSYNDNRTIINYKDYVNKRITDLRQKHNYMEQYSFAPSLDKNSIKIENSKECNKDKQRYEYLYDNYKNQQMNKEKLSHQIYNEEILFKPSVNQYNCPYTSMSFHDRQGYFLSKSVEKKKLTKDVIEANINQETGRPYFYPQINDYNNINTEYRTTFDNLYLDSTQNRNRLRDKEEKNNTIFQTMQNSSHINKESNEIFEEMKEKAFKQIFKCLDKNQEGVITHIYIDTKVLPKSIADILMPIFNSLKEENVSLNEREFIVACFHLFEILTYVQRKELLSFDKRKKPVDCNMPQFTFKPSINADRDRSSKLNKSMQSITSSNKSVELNSLRQNLVQQYYQKTGAWPVQNEEENKKGQ